MAQYSFQIFILSRIFERVVYVAFWVGNSNFLRDNDFAKSYLSMWKQKLDKKGNLRSRKNDSLFLLQIFFSTIIFKFKCTTSSLYHVVLRTRIEVENMILPFFSLGNFTDNLMHRTKAVAMAQEWKRNEASYQKHSGWVGGHAIWPISCLKSHKL